MLSEIVYLWDKSCWNSLRELQGWIWRATQVELRCYLSYSRSKCKESIQGDSKNIYRKTQFLGKIVAKIAKVDCNCRVNNCKYRVDVG